MSRPTALPAAGPAGAGSREAVKLLAAHGANVNAVESRKEQSALMWAAAEGHSDTVAILIQPGADVKPKSAAGFTPLVFAESRTTRNQPARGRHRPERIRQGVKQKLLTYALRRG